MRIVYMGTPFFAVPPLQLLIKNGFKPVAVVTAPDKPAGRGLKLKSSPVKETAVDAGIPVLQPPNLKDPEFLEVLKALQPDLQFVVAFRMLPEQVWNLPRLGTYNLHASLLPDYRGAAPINHAIISGETITGLTTFKLRHEIDTGAIAFQTQLSIGPDETAGELHDRMMPVGADLVLKTVKALESEMIHLQDQPLSTGNSANKVAPKLNPAFCRINFHEPVIKVHDKIRGLSPFPGATAEMHSGNRIYAFKLLKSRISHLSNPCQPGEVLISGKNNIYVSCADGWLELIILQPSGKNTMSAAEFLNGFRPAERVFFT
jgi:methionyl-tRNA formyltransferase